jgi:hypothetical protein
MVPDIQNFIASFEGSQSSPPCSIGMNNEKFHRNYMRRFDSDREVNTFHLGYKNCHLMLYVKIIIFVNPKHMNTLWRQNVEFILWYIK